jgi:hypothetical protein
MPKHAAGWRFHLSLLALFITTILLAGCASQRLEPVSGKVTVDGKPLEKGAVVYTPEESNPFKEEVRGDITNGDYTLFTQGRPGAPAGPYKVTVSGAQVPSNPKDPYSVPVNLVNVKYTDLAKTDIRIEVTASPAAGAYDLKLTK